MLGQEIRRYNYKCKEETCAFVNFICQLAIKQVTILPSTAKPCNKYFTKYDYLQNVAIHSHSHILPEVPSVLKKKKCSFHNVLLRSRSRLQMLRGGKQGGSTPVLGLFSSGYPRTGTGGKNFTEPDLDLPENLFMLQKRTQNRQKIKVHSRIGPLDLNHFQNWELVPSDV